MVPNNYKLVFEDTFQGFELDTNKWRDQQPWGRLHAGSPYQYYGKDSIHVNTGMVLSYFICRYRNVFFAIYC